MLVKFFRFNNTHPTAVYIHWNMQSIVFGFEALEHRYRVITQEEPFHVPDLHKINLNDFLKLKYGEKYVPHPRMQNLMKLNDGTPQGFLTGQDEVTAFVQRQYINLYKSSSEKCRWLAWIYNRSLNGKLRTMNSSLLQKAVFVGETTIFKILSIIAIVFSVYQAIVYIVSNIAKSVFNR